MPIVIHTDCRYYKGSVLCVFHKQEGRLCEGYVDYAPVETRILVVKLAAVVADGSSRNGRWRISEFLPRAAKPSRHPYAQCMA